ncbi:MAG: glycosyltransferase [Pseudonocardiaceae bacterium]
MSRFLFVVPPLVGHINPAVGVAAALQAKGHRVAWAGVPEIITPLAGADATVFGCAGPRLGTGDAARPDLRGLAALKLLWEHFFLPLADAMAPGVLTAVERFHPDVLVADQQALAGGLIAERLGIPWATSATTSGELVGSLDGMPKVQAWLNGLLDGLRQRTGDPAGAADPRFSPHLLLAFTTAEFVGPSLQAGPQVRFVGPVLRSRRSTAQFPWSWLDPARQTVLITLGTVSAEVGARFLAQCTEAALARSDRLQTVIVDPTSSLRRIADGVLTTPRVPQLELLDHVDAVVCHAGHNTVCEALWHGLPLVVAPIRDDQTIIAQQVADAGAGIRVRFNRVDAQRLGTAIDTVLGRPDYRTAAGRVSRSFRAAGGADAAAGHLERIANQPAVAGRHAR